MTDVKGLESHRVSLLVNIVFVSLDILVHQKSFPFLFVYAILAWL